MGIKKRKTRWPAWGICLGLLACLLLLPRCIRLHKTDKEIARYFKDTPVKPQFYTYTQNGWQMHYAAIGADTLPMVVFVHGSPGSWDAFIRFFKDSTLYSQYRSVSVDRPGYGKSEYGEAEPSLQRQAALLMPVLKTSKSAQKPMLIGHSLGGPVAARMAMDYPALIGQLILVAPSVDPMLEKKERYRRVLNWSLIRKWLPVELDVSNQEIMPLKGELQKMLPLWESIQVPVCVIQGDADVLVDPRNAVFVQCMLPRQVVQVRMLSKVNHFIPWTHPHIIRETILYSPDSLQISVDKKVK